MIREPGGAQLMRRTLIEIGATAVAMVSAAMPVCAQVELPEPVYQVSMSASYERDSHHIDGIKKIRWRNTSSVPIDELQFHLYLNAFANARSTFMIGSGGQLRDIKIPEDGWGWIEVQTMRLAYGEDLITRGIVSEEEGVEPFRRPFAETVPDEPQPLELDDRVDLKVANEKLGGLLESGRVRIGRTDETHSHRSRGLHQLGPELQNVRR